MGDAVTRGRGEPQDAVGVGVADSVGVAVVVSVGVPVVTGNCPLGTGPYPYPRCNPTLASEGGG